MKIKVISLETSVQRRTSIEQQFEGLDTAFEFFDAVTPDGSHEHIGGYDEFEFVVNCGRPATETELACYASHLALWRQCAEEGVPYLILEDDARLDDTFLAGLIVAKRQIDNLGFVRVSLPELSTSVLIQRIGAFDIHFCRRVPLAALGYAISPRTATQLVRHGGTVEEPVDKYLQRFWRHEQPVFAIAPPIVHLSEHAQESDIGPRIVPRPKVSTWLRRIARKTHNFTARTLYAARFLKSSRRYDYYT